MMCSDESGFCDVMCSDESGVCDVMCSDGSGFCDAMCSDGSAVHVNMPYVFSCELGGVFGEALNN